MNLKLNQRSSTGVLKMKAGDVSQMKARQCAKIKELHKVLIVTGFRSLDEQAKALGLSRSTTWTIIKASHKNSGLSASVINRILAKPQLPPLVRATVVEYVEDKSAGLYGHNKISLRRFNCAIDSSASSPRKTHESGDPYSKCGCERHNGSPVSVSRHDNKLVDCSPEFVSGTPSNLARLMFVAQSSLWR
jgi:hypothetical protein